MKLKNKIILLMACMVLCLCFTSCNRNYSNANECIESVCGDYFVQIKKWADFSGLFSIVYAKDTKVKYLIWRTSYKGSITPLYNADGSLQVYEEGE